MTTLPRRRALHAIQSGILLVLLALPPVDTAAQPPSKVRRVGILSAFSGPLSAQPEFGRALGELGYVEGKNLVIEHRYANGQYDRLSDQAAELARLNVEVIVTVGTIAAKAAKKATTTIPIIIMVGGDPVGTGLAGGLARPGGNVTGLSLMTTELSAKRLELLKQAVPRTSRVVILWSPDVQPLYEGALKAMRAVAPSLRLELQTVHVASAADLRRAFAQATAAHADALYVMSSPLFIDNRSLVIQLVASSRLPAVYGGGDFAEAGGLMSYGASFSDAFHRAALYVDKILKGAKPGDLPIEQPTRFELVINLKTAKALGLTIPDFLLVRADKVIR
jgi:putative ABC transport system substrate-binding protein